MRKASMLPAELESDQQAVIVLLIAAKATCIMACIMTVTSMASCKRRQLATVIAGIF